MHKLLAVFIICAVLSAGCAPVERPTITASPTATPPVVPTASASAPAPSATALAGTFVELKGHTAPVTRVAWSPDRELVATTAGDWQSSDPTIRLWRADGTLVKVLEGHTAPVLALAWSPDGSRLASGSLDTTIRIWQADGTLVRTIHSPDETVSLAWSPDGQILASASTPVLNPMVRWWRVDGTLVRSTSTQFTGGKFYNLLWSPDGKFLLGGATDYKLWRADGTQVFHLEACAHCTPAWAAGWSPDATRWAVGDENGAINVFDTAGQRVAGMQDEQGDVNVLAWSPDGQALAGGDGVQLWRADGSVLAGHVSFGRVQALAWSPDGGRLVSLSSGGGMRLWSAQGKLLAAYPGSFAGAAWSAAGALVAAEQAGNDVKLWRFGP